MRWRYARSSKGGREKGAVLTVPDRPLPLGAQIRRMGAPDAPPFMAIGSKFGFDPDALVFALVGPHEKMNFGLRRPEAEDVAAYIATLAGDW
jgi:hypothetical protein